MDRPIGSERLLLFDNVEGMDTVFLDLLIKFLKKDALFFHKSNSTEETFFSLPIVVILDSIYSTAVKNVVQAVSTRFRCFSPNVDQCVEFAHATFGSKMAPANIRPYAELCNGDLRNLEFRVTRKTFSYRAHQVRLNSFEAFNAFLKDDSLDLATLRHVESNTLEHLMSDNYPALFEDDMEGVALVAENLITHGNMFQPEYATHIVPEYNTVGAVIQSRLAWRKQGKTHVPQITMFSRNHWLPESHDPSVYQAMMKMTNKRYMWDMPAVIRPQFLENQPN